MDPTLLRNLAGIVALQAAEKNPHFRTKIESIAISVSHSLRVTAGRAYVHENRIELSIPIFSLPENQHDFADTVLHEIAHILRGENGHDWLWRNIAISIGCNGNRCHSLKTVRNTRRLLEAKCLACKEKMLVRASMIRNGKTYYHKKCGGRVIA